MGLRGSDTAAIALDDVEVPDDAVLGEIGEGFKIAMSALDSGRYSVAAGCVGICQGCVDSSVRYSKEREQFGRPIASLPARPGDDRRHGPRPTPRGCSCGGRAT